jgi:hypothetical protein
MAAFPFLLAEIVAIAFSLNPFTISHTAKIISYAATGTPRIAPQNEILGKIADQRYYNI